MSEPTIGMLIPMTPGAASKLLKRLDDDMSKNITKDQARAALVGYLKAFADAADVARHRDELLIALEALRVATAALAVRIDDEMDLDRNDKPNWAMRLGSEFGGVIGRACEAADAAIAKARGGK